MRALECWCGQRCECKREPASARNAPDPRSCLRIINHSAASPPSLLGPQTYIYRSVVRPTCGRRAMLLLRAGAGPSRSYGHGLKVKCEMTLFTGLCRSLLRPVRSVVMATGTKKFGSEAGGILVAKSEVTAFIERCMVAVGTQPAHAKALADNLTMADYRGHFSHGLNRLGTFSFTKFIETVLCVTKFGWNNYQAIPSPAKRPHDSIPAAWRKNDPGETKWPQVV